MIFFVKHSIFPTYFWVTPNSDYIQIRLWLTISNEVCNEIGKRAGALTIATLRWWQWFDRKGNIPALVWLSVKAWEWCGSHCYIVTANNKTHWGQVVNEWDAHQCKEVASCCWRQRWGWFTKKGLQTALDWWFVAEDLCVAQWYCTSVFCVPIHILKIRWQANYILHLIVIKNYNNLSR